MRTRTSLGSDLEMELAHTRSDDPYLDVKNETPGTSLLFRKVAIRQARRWFFSAHRLSSVDALTRKHYPRGDFASRYRS